MDTWNPELYLRFTAERTKPARDLASNIKTRNPERILDIGCGPGNSTQILSEMFPDAEITGIDSSMNMIESARANCPSAHFFVCDAADIPDEIGNDFDIVFSNACLQWLPEHEKLLEYLFSFVKKGGALAVQVPNNYDQPIHRIISKLAEQAQSEGKLKEQRIFHKLTPERYFDVLGGISDDFTIWETAYFHRMSSHDSIIDWYKSTGLKPYLSQLNEQDAILFENEVREKVAEAYPIMKNGEVMFKFPRLFFIAYR